ncbi:MAG TPA: histidine phosphatase family protein, partial [Candidatus Cybelea sp.]|nr:histidine phosphatase family protein [Candidatus Cybelea sp.]
MLLLMRHGPTRANDDHRIRSVVNFPLSDEGHRLASDLAEQVQGFPLASLTSSPLDRAVDSMKPVSDATGVPFSTHDGLLPWDMGQLAGQDVSRVQPFIRDLLQHPDVKAPGGQSFNEFAHALMSTVWPAIQDDKLHGVMAHGSVAQTIEAAVRNRSKNLASAVSEDRPSIDPGGMALVTPEKFIPLHR